MGAKHKVIVAGNHDITFHEEYYLDRGAARFHRQAVPDPSSARLNFEVKPYDCFECRRLLDSHIYLEDTAVEVCGYRIYGSPWQPEFCDWAFNLGPAECAPKWAEIPQDVDILITHGPPKGMGDRTSLGLSAGCEHLLSAIRERPVTVSLAG